MIISLIVLHFLLGAGIVAAGDRLGRRESFGTLGPVARHLAVLKPWHHRQRRQGRRNRSTHRLGSNSGLTFDLRADAFAAVMLALISVIGVAVCVYAVAYFGSDNRASDG